MKWIKDNWFNLSVLGLVCIFVVGYFYINTQGFTNLSGRNTDKQEEVYDYEEETKVSNSELTLPEISDLIKEGDSGETSVTKQQKPMQQAPSSVVSSHTPTPSAINENVAVNVTPSLYCTDLKKEFDTFNTLLLTVGHNSIAVKDNYYSGSYYSDQNTPETVYTQLLAQKNAYDSRILQLQNSTNQIPSLSFAIVDVSSLKQNFMDGANSFQNAFDLRLQSFKYVYDNPNSLSALDDAELVLKQAASKAELGQQSLVKGFEINSNIGNAYDKLRSQNNCI